MHATRDTNLVIERNLAGGRVMRGVRLLGLIKSLAETRGRQWRAALSQAGIPLSPGAALRINLHGARREVRAPRMAGARDVRGISVAHPNKPMHPTADTPAVMNSKGLGRRVIGGVMLLALVKGEWKHD